ncbi:MAG TPA: RIP metalloprotease RseP [Candidatus Fraserbacteria bacterium]|nr:RIP metalloprotease RseP [Candidatus Fraserbacteria bacterium]
MMILQTIIAFFVAISFLVFIHEGGHFLVAKWVGVWVHQFAIGFGPAFLRWRGRETEYSLRIFPAGGFVRMAGDEEPAAGAKKGSEQEPAEEPAEPQVPPDRLFSAKSPWQRMAIIAAGPTMNIIGAVVMIILLAGLAGVPSVQVAGFSENSPAAAAAMQPGDIIVAINGQQIYFSQQVSQLIQSAQGRPLTIQVARGAERRQLTVTPYWDKDRGRYLIGILFNGILLNQIGQLATDAPLARQGLQRGDVILSVNGQPIDDWFEFAQGLRVALQAGAAQAHLRLLRGSQLVKQSLDLSAGPADLAGWLKGANPALISVYPSDNVVQEIGAKSFLAQQGLQKGDRLLSANGEPLHNFVDLIYAFERTGQTGGRLALKLQRAGGERTLRFEIPDRNPQAILKLLGGMQLQLALRKPSGLWQSLVVGFRETWDILVTFYQGMRSIIVGKTPASKALSGPVGIANILGKSLQQGLVSFLFLIALLSLNLGIINLVPFPALDGSRILFIFYELVRGKPIPAEKEGWIHAIGFFVLIGLLLLITYNDILRLLGQ